MQRRLTCLVSTPMRLVLTALASLAAASSGAALPAADLESRAVQNASDGDELAEIVVTGFRESLQSALQTKRQSNLPIESVAAEDIGKMPDQNVAESLQRLPGVQIDRTNGQGTAVLIDGLRQNLTTLNGDVFLTGKEFYVSGEGSGSGAGSNAQYGSLEGIPSELIAGIDVYKNPRSSMTEGGLGGTINLITRDPLKSPDGLSLAGNFRESHAQSTTGITPDGTAVVSFKLNERFAFSGSVTFDDERTHIKEFQDQNRNQWLVTNAATGPYVGALTPAGLSTVPQNYIEPQLGYFTDILDDREKRAVSLGAAVKVTDSLTTRVIWFYSHEADTSYNYSDKVWFNGQGAAPGSLLPGIDPTQPYSIDGRGVVQNATFNANGAETATRFENTVSQADNYQWATEFDDGGPWRGGLDLSYAKATSDLQAAQADIEHGLYDAFSGVATSPGAPGCNNGASTCTDATGSHGYEFSYANGGTSGLPAVTYRAPYADILNNSSYATFKSNWAWANYTDERQFGIKGELQYEMPFATSFQSTLSTGVRYAGRDVGQNFGRYLIDGAAVGVGGVGAGTSAGNCCIGPGSGTYLYYQDPGYATIPYSTAVSNPNLGSLVPNFAVGSILVKNPSAGGMNNPSTYLERVWAGAGMPNNTEKFFKDGLSSFDVRERTTAPYLMLDMGGRTTPFHLNVGVRLVKTDLTIDNGETAVTPTFEGTAVWNGVESNVVPVQIKRSYADILPSLNVVYDVSAAQKIRLGLAKVMSPQDLFSLGLGNTYGFTRGSDGTTGQARFQFSGGSSGNPYLDPYRAKQFYVSYENYFAPGALAGVAGFYKQVDNFVEVQNVPTRVDDDFGGTTADVSEPVNAGHGKIYGLEFGGQYGFNIAVAALQGLGIAANYTYSHSETDQATSFSYDSPIPGVSKNSLTGTLYYERAGFSSRASYSWRGMAVNDSLVGSTFAFPNQNGVEQVYQVFSAPYGQLDAQIGYDFSAHVGLFMSVINLTDEPQHTYLQFPNLPFSYDDSGRRFFLGIKGKY